MRVITPPPLPRIERTEDRVIDSLLSSENHSAAEVVKDHYDIIMILGMEYSPCITERKTYFPP